MDVRVLRYFLAVCQEGSITGAADVCLTTQPNLSRQLADLERELGHTLFERGRTVRLTEEGLFLRRRAQEIVELLERTESDLVLFDEQAAGDVYVDGAESPGMALVAEAIGRLRKEAPLVRLHLFSDSTNEARERLDAGMTDFAVMVGEPDADRYDHLRLPHADIWGVLMPADHPLAAKETVTANDVSGEPLLLAEQQLEANVFSGWLGTAPEDLDVVATFNLINTPAMLVEHGLGLAFTFEGLLNTEGRNLAFRPVTPRMESALFLAWKRHATLGRAQKLFLDQIRAIIAHPSS